MARIPTPLPEHIGTLIRDFFRGSLGLILWRTIVLAAGVLVLYLAVQNAGFLLAFLITSIIGAYYMDDITATLTNVWNANFWVLRV